MKHIARIIALFSTVVCALAATAPEGVRIEKDVDYLGADRKEKADLYLPAEVPKGRRCPGVVIIHGGGWVGGDKGAGREINIGTTLAQHGYVGMSINYVLATKESTAATWPQNLHDCKTAVRWLRKNAGRLQLDPDHIGVIGGSAGGHLAAMVAVTGLESGLDPAGPYGEFSCRVQAAVDLYGPTLWFATKDLAMFRKTRSEAPEQYCQATPMTHVDKNDPPILILHGTADGTVPVADSEAFAAALKKAGAEHQLVIVEGGPHSFHLQPKQQDLRPLVLGFFDKHLKRNQSP
ncbi:MAG: alpha/beta hydrolase [Verrucomicrobia bacterium]|nr:alpha/beta hydrolase [Verrucomicrobiota bacterium]